jgi:hypothetical protein
MGDPGDHLGFYPCEVIASGAILSKADTMQARPAEGEADDKLVSGPGEIVMSAVPCHRQTVVK